MAIPISEVLDRAGMYKLLSEVRGAIDKIYASKSYVDEKLVNVSSSVLTDTVTGLKYKLGVENGSLILIETDASATSSSIVLTDDDTGIKYNVIVENGSLTLVETGSAS